MEKGASGTITGDLAVTGNISANATLSLGGGLVISGQAPNAGYTAIYDNSAAGAIFLGGSEDATNYYRQTRHRFQDRAANDAVLIDGDGLTQSLGPNAGFFMHGRDNSEQEFGWYVTGNVARFWHNENNDLLAVGATGGLCVLPHPAPAAPPSGWVLYVDAADGRLKAIASTGTIVTLGTP
jgi:hypothetical protein